MKYINQTGTRFERKDNLCTSCMYNKFFFSLPSFKHINRCSKTGVVTSSLQLNYCKYYKKRRILSEIIVGV